MKSYFWPVSPTILSLIIVLVIVFVLKSLPPRLPLFYSLPWGEAQLATHEQFLIIPALISTLTILNLIVYSQLHPSQIFLKKLLLSSSIIVSLVLSITFVKIILNFI